MSKEYSKLWKGFWQLADPKIWIASTVPMVLGTALAYRNHRTFDLYWFALSLIGVYLIEIGKNAINEFVDYESGVDRYVIPEKRTPFSGGKKTIVDGILTLHQAKIIGIATMVAAGIIGLYIALVREPLVLWVGVAGFLLSILYSLPPFKLAYRGLGELVVGFVFGPLILCGAYMVQAHTLEMEAMMASLVLGFLIANVLVINEYPDYEADLKGNKKNLVVRLGKQKSLKMYELLYVMAYIAVIALMLATKNPKWALGFLSVPLAKSSVACARKYYDDIPRLMEANAKTVLTYQLTGLGLTVAALFL